MKNFRSTLVVAVVAIALGVFSYLEYKKSIGEEDTKIREGRLYPDLEASQVQKLRLQNGEMRFEFAKENGEWKMLQPLTDKADTAAVDSLVEGIIGETVKELEFEKDNKPDLISFGLTTASPTIELELAGEKKITLTVGQAEAYDGSRYVKKSDSDAVYVGSREWNGYVSKNVRELRDKMIYGGGASPKKIVIAKKGEKPFELVDSDGKWELAGQKDLKIDGETVLNYVSGLRSMRVVDFLSETKDPVTLKKFGLNAPDGSIQVGDWKFEFVSKDNEAYVVTSSRDTVFKAGALERDKWLKTVEHFRDKKFPFRQDPVATPAELTISGEPAKVHVVKKDGQWRLKEEIANKEVDDAQVQSLLDGLARLEVKRFTAKEGPALDKMPNRLALMDDKGQKIFEMGWGEKQKDKDNVELFRGRTSLAAESFLIEASRLSALPFARLVKDKAPPPSETAKDAKDLEKK